MCYSPVRHSLFISIATEWTAFDLHVLGTPPAFVLSQDQTLHRGLGSAPEGFAETREPTRDDSSPVDRQARASPRGPPSLPMHYFDVRPKAPKRREPPALAFGSRSSVFKERP